MTAGSALLALAGPVGWSIAGATLLSSILLFTSKKAKMNKQKNEEVQAVKKNIESVRELDGEISLILSKTTGVRSGLNDMLVKSLPLFGADYLALDKSQKQLLGALVNNTKALSAMLERTVSEA